MSEEAVQFHARFDSILDLLDTDIKQLASDIGVSKDTFYSMRSAGRTPSYDTLSALKSKYPMVNLDYLISGVGKPLLGISEYIKVETKTTQVKEDPAKYVLPENNPMLQVIQKMMEDTAQINQALLDFLRSNTPEKV